MQPIKADNYTIFFNTESYSMLNQLLILKKYSKLFLLSDSNSNDYCVPHFLSNLATTITIEIIEIEAGEDLKNIKTCIEIWNILTDLGADKKSVIINIGGGVITDLGGFVASTYKRGINFINVPTTLLAMVDAAIGGKNGVDLGVLKNQIGLIQNPEIVVVDTAFLQTLPQNQIKSGLAEMLKHGLIADKKYWEEFLDLNQLNFDNFDQLIHRSIKIKNDIVMQDPTENGIRKALNFGHTLGHAIESHFLESKKRLLHGEAIAIGMILESFISKEKKTLSNTNYQQIKTTILNLFTAIHFSKNDINCIIELLVHDKKNEYGKVQFVLLNGIGKTSINQEVEKQLIIASFNDYKL